MKTIMERKIFETRYEAELPPRSLYPERIFDYILETATFTECPSLLELESDCGCASEFFAERGMSVRASGLRAWAGRTLRCDDDDECFDLIYSAKNDVRVPRREDLANLIPLLKAGGAVALIRNVGVCFQGEADMALQSISRKYGDVLGLSAASESRARVQDNMKKLNDARIFSSLSIHQHLWKEYVSHSDDLWRLRNLRAFDERATLEKMYIADDLANLYDRYDGEIERTYICTVYLGRVDDMRR